MVRHAARTLSRIRWSGGDAARFLGRFLTTPKPQVVFRPPARPLARAAFARRGTVVLDAKTQLLYRGKHCYCNGEEYATARALRVLADQRRALVRPAQADLFYGWYLAGYLHPE